MSLVVNSGGGGGIKIGNAVSISLKAAEDIEKNTLVGAKISLISAKDQGYFIPYHIQSMPCRIDDNHFIHAGHGYNNITCYAQVCTVADNGAITGGTKLQLNANSQNAIPGIRFGMSDKRYLYQGLIGNSTSEQFGLLGIEDDGVTVSLKSQCAMQHYSNAIVIQLDERRFCRMYVDVAINTFKAAVYNIDNNVISLETTHDLKLDSALNGKSPDINATRIDDYTFLVKYSQNDLKFTKAFVAKYNPVLKAWSDYETLVISATLQVSGLDINVDGTTVLIINRNVIGAKHYAVDIGADYTLTLRMLSDMQETTAGCTPLLGRIFIGFDRTDLSSDAEAILKIYLMSKNGILPIAKKQLALKYERFSNGFIKLSEDTFIGHPFGSDYFFGVLKFEVKESCDSLIPIGITKDGVGQGQVGQVFIKE